MTAAFFGTPFKNHNYARGGKMCILLISRWYKVTTVHWTFRECDVSSWI